MGDNVFRSGAGRISLDFLRTLRYRGTPRQEEELPDAVALAQWITQLTAVDAAPEAIDAQDVRTAHEVREAARALISRARGEESSGGDSTADEGGAAKALRTLNAAARHPTPVLQLTARGAIGVTAESPARAVLSEIARDVFDLLADPVAIGRLRNCANPECRTLFLDLSRPGTRRWCDMNTCGNREKKRRQHALG